MKQIAAPPKAVFSAIGVGVTKGYELINEGKLETIKIGRSTRILIASAEAYVESLRSPERLREAA